ncbi:MAG: hypothetical protein VB102_05530, partial [Paludibacter sp.]|nr:hypothetical protein [Paludibacter sp.]
MRVKSVKIIVYQFLIIVIHLFLWSCDQNDPPIDDEKEIPEEIFEPTIVGIPTVNPYNSLFMGRDGEIRHYSDDGFLYSKNDGLTWRYRSFSDNVGVTFTGKRPLAMNPKTGTCIRVVSGNGTKIQRSVDGVEGKYVSTQISDVNISMIRPAYFLPSGRAVIVAGQTGSRPYQIAVFRSVDDGVRWTTTVLPAGPAFVVAPPHK